MSVLIKGKEYVKAPQGMHHAVSVDVEDLGTLQTDFGMKRKVRLVWELQTKMPDGRPYTASKRYTASLHPKSALHEDLKGWRGKSFTSEEMKNFDLENVLNKPCQLLIQHEDNDGEVYANIKAILPADQVIKVIPSGKFVRAKDRQGYKSPQQPEEIEPEHKSDTATTAPEDSIPF